MLHTGQKPEIPEVMPDWSTRPWGRPSVQAASSQFNPRLVAMVEFRYHGIRILGVRVFHNENGYSVNMPQKKFGDVIESVCFFTDHDERDQFCKDVEKGNIGDCLKQHKDELSADCKAAHKKMHKMHERQEKRSDKAQENAPAPQPAQQ